MIPNEGHRPASLTSLARLRPMENTVAQVNGYRIRTVHTRFGCLLAVDGTPRAFATLDAAAQYAASLPRAEPVR